MKDLYAGFSCYIDLNLWQCFLVSSLILLYPLPFNLQVLWAVLQRQPMLYEQEDVADACSMKHGLMQKTIIPLNPQIETDKPEIWQLVTGIIIGIFAMPDV